MSYLRTTEAARLLNVSPNTLRSWERRFGYPTPARSIGGHRQFLRTDIVALGDALMGGMSISSAVSLIREGLVVGTPHSLRGALVAFDADSATLVLESSLAVRSLPRTIEDVLLPGLEELHASVGAESTRWGFASDWALAWLARARAFVRHDGRRGAVLIGHGCSSCSGPCLVRSEALSLLCAHEGAIVSTVSVRARLDLGPMLEVLRPDLLVACVGPSEADAAAAWLYAVRHSGYPSIPLVTYQPGSPAGDARRSTSADRLVGSPIAATQRIMVHLDRGRGASRGYERLSL